MVSLRSLVVGAAFIAAPVLAALTPSEIVNGLSELSKQARDLQPVAQSITIINGPLLVIGQGPFPILLQGFSNMVTTGKTLLAQSSETPEIESGEDATLVFGAFRGFALVTQELLKILIGKAGLLSHAPLIGPPVASSLRSLEEVVDSIVIFLVDTVVPKAEDLQSEANSLAASLDACIKQYEGLEVQKRAKVFVA